jgi:aspartate kinase
VIVVKFGGTSLAGTERMRAAARIVAAHGRDRSVVCVVSAMAGVTDALLRVTTATTSGTTAWRPLLTELRTRHFDTLTTLTTDATVSGMTSRFEALWSELEEDLVQLQAAAVTPGAAYEHAVAAFSAWGERLSVLLFAAALVGQGVAAGADDRAPVVLVERPPLSPGAASGLDVARERLAPSVAATRRLLAPRLGNLDRAERVLVLPGYLARTEAGDVTTLGRNGSDWSAALIAAALHAESVYIYSDVCGVHRADPHVVPEADPLPALTYADAAEVAALGARVLHPDALRPLAAARIPLHLRSSFTPEAPGTDIGSREFVRARVGASEAWVVVARPLTPERPLYGMLTDDREALVEVVGHYLRHKEMPAREDDLLRPEALTPAVPDAPPPGDGPVSGALALLSGTPRPLGLALSGTGVSVAVPAAEAAATQRRLYAALARARGPVRAPSRSLPARLGRVGTSAQRRRSS